MLNTFRTPRLACLVLIGCLASAGVSPLAWAGAAPDSAETPATRQDPAVTKPALDRSGRRRVGNASLYAKRFAGKKMADGQLMKPLGTTAKVTNLKTGQSAVVTIQDRGPYVKGRIVDLSSATAKQIGIEHEKGVTKVAVTPIAVPLADGTVKAGAAAADVP